jgi:hypothetical protein
MILQTNHLIVVEFKTQKILGLNLILAQKLQLGEPGEPGEPGDFRQGEIVLEVALG